MWKARSFLLSSALVVTIAICASARQIDRESLKSALEAVTRKQRSLDFVPQDYYNELRSFKFHPGDAAADDKFDRSRQQTLENDDNDDDDDEDLEFLPLDNGQLENIGGGYQNFNNKRLERALMDYLENPSTQRENVASPFRERERNGGHKRGSMNNRDNGSDGNKELAALFYKELQNGPTYNAMGDVDNHDYSLSDTLQSYYDRYRAEQNKIDKNKLYDSGQMSWGDMFGKQESSRNHVGTKNNDDDDDDDDDVNDRDSMYMLPAERRNVNGRYPLGRDYSLLFKRYPMLTKRSPKPLQTERQNSGVITDPKVAKDLGALFGGETDGAKNNHTHDHRDKMEHGAHDHNERRDGHADSRDHEHAKERADHDHDHNHDHDHEHNHDHDHDHNHEHDHDHEHERDHDHDHGHDHDHDDDNDTTPSGSHATEATSESPNGFNAPGGTDKPGQKEISNSSSNKVGKILNKRNQRAVDVNKKNIDWSDYFGIDRRKKKAALLARPDSQDQDDEWMLQRYYKTMAENLKSPEKNVGPDRDSGEKRDKLDQMDTKLKNVKNLIVEDALKYGSDDNSDPQEVKDVVMARLAAAYSLEKMRRALDEFRSNIAAQKQLMRAAHAKNNTSGNFRDDYIGNENEKRNVDVIDDGEANLLEGRNFEGCPELESIERSCQPANGLIPELYELCVRHHICRACDDEKHCSKLFTPEATKICDDMDETKYRHCVLVGLVIWHMPPSPMASAVCHATPDSCLRREYRYRHRGFY